MLCLHHSLNVCMGQRVADKLEDSSIQVVSKEYAGSDTQQVSVPKNTAPTTEHELPYLEVRIHRMNQEEGIAKTEKVGKKTGEQEFFNKGA